MNSTWVFDATPLIYLAKAERLSHLDHLDGRRLIPRRVYDEVVTDGLDHEYADARRIDRQVDAGTFAVASVASDDGQLPGRLEENESVSDADVAVLALAAERDGVAVMDDRYGRDVAETEGIRTRGTASLVLSLASDGVPSRTDAMETIDAMIAAGWYCSLDLYAKIRGRLESID